MRSILAIYAVALSVGCLRAHISWVDSSSFAALTRSWSDSQERAAAARIDDLFDALDRVDLFSVPDYWVPFFHHHCGVVLDQASSEADYLQADLVDALSQPFRDCRSLRIEVLSTEVDIRDYPVGYFGDFVYDGRMIIDRVRVSDETDIIFCFQMIAGSPFGDAFEDHFLLWQDPQIEDDFRRSTRFRPNIRVIFEGEHSFELDINTRSGDAIGRYLGKWAPYLVQGRTFELLAEVVGKIGKNGAEPGATDNPDGAQRLREDH